MKAKWLFFDLGGTIYDESLSDKQRAENLIKKIDSGITYNEFYAEMKKASAEYAPSPFTYARNKLGIAENEPYSNKKEFLYPKVHDVICELSESYNLGIIANQPSDTLERLKKDKLYDYFKICLLSECENLFKPDERFFYKALEKAHCLPSEAVMIGDRLDNDIFPAKNIGMKTIRIIQGLHSVQKALNDRYTADHEINTFEDLLNVLSMAKCRCHHLPKKGSFHIGIEYQYSYIIDSICVTDDNGNRVDFNEYIFLWYFIKL